ncbi:uncharacterized protein LOC124183103 [Neodiprion fabricii]|uniref:uncharacterized protein LOC124183103 n=1 Tax=Neodiprion fabricii TaxID=2872261 RepID=UPI001ED97644|nr:uncharacterized protein LOC124183103 [Neodiprion fabricii]
MESLSAPDRGVNVDREDARTSEPGSSSLGSTTTEGNPESGTSSSVPEPSEHQQAISVPADFLPIKMEIKKMGVEISDERAEQLKNDVRRLSPEVVSLRERTLGEISLTPDSTFYEVASDANDEEISTEQKGSESTPSSAEKHLIAEEDLRVQLSRHQETEHESSSWWSRKVKCDSEVVSGEELVMIARNDEKAENSESGSVGEVEYGVGRTEQTPSSPRAVIQKLVEGEEIVFAGADVACVQLQASSMTNGLDFIVAYPEASPCSSTESAEDPLRDAETETDSDCSSEPAAICAATEPVESLQTRGDSTDIIVDCDRVQSDRPQTFTEDSAESLALAAGAGDEVRSDGSDSGLGGEIAGEPGPAPAPESDSETSFLDRIPNEILSNKDKASEQLETFVPVKGDAEMMTGSEVQRPDLLAIPILPALQSPPKSNLKRRLTDCMEGEPDAKRLNPDESQKKKRNIQFDAVTVYYFPRAQGFTCVPSQGGSTLGMSAAHTHAERFSLTEHAAEQRRIHRARLAQLRSERAANNVVEAASSSEDPSDDTDEEPSDTEELDIDSYYFLLPVPTWQRRALLRAAGVQKIDTVEKDECRDIRASRKHCGCGCKGYCDPESCPCSRAHVKCQVDRAGFPCGCSRDGCANSSGRIEFNPVRVRTHFIHTLMRLELEKKHRDEDCTDLHDLDAQRGLPVGMDGVEGSCAVNGGGFTTLHYTNPPQEAGSCQQPEIPGTREDSLDLYAIRDDCYQTCSEDTVDSGAQGQPQHHHHHHHHHHQRKLLHPTEFVGPPFQQFSNGGDAAHSVQQFQQNTYQDYQSYQTLPSTSRGQFHHQFQSVSHTPQAFSHYGGYVTDPMGAGNVVTSMSVACHQQAPSNYETNYVQQDEGPPSHYTNLNSVQQPTMSSVHHQHHHQHHQQLGKLEPFSELLAGRYSYYGEVESTSHQISYPTVQQPDKANSEDDKSLQHQRPETSQPQMTEQQNSGEDCSDENFGEIIKKSMVETVSA